MDLRNGQAQKFLTPLPLSSMVLSMLLQKGGVETRSVLILSNTAIIPGASLKILALFFCRNSFGISGQYNMYKLFIVIHFSNQFYFTVGVLCIIYYVQVSAIIGFFFSSLFGEITSES
jgi:hypothetical protein